VTDIEPKVPSILVPRVPPELAVSPAKLSHLLSGLFHE
jgi:hypothetical protein